MGQTWRYSSKVHFLCCCSISVWAAILNSCKVESFCAQHSEHVSDHSNAVQEVMVGMLKTDGRTKLPCISTAQLMPRKMPLEAEYCHCHLQIYRNNIQVSLDCQSHRMYSMSNITYSRLWFLNSQGWELGRDIKGTGREGGREGFILSVSSAVM